MPLVSQDYIVQQTDITSNQRNQVDLRDLEKHEDTISDITSAAFTLENSIAGSINEKSNLDGIPITRDDAVKRPLKEFNFSNHIPTGYEQYANMYAYINDPEEAKKVTKHIDSLLEANAIRARNPVTGIVTSMAAGILDWPTLIPNLGAVGAATKIGKVGRGALSVGGTAAATVGVQEYMLRSQQGDTRPMEVSGLAVASAAIFGGIIGGAAPLVPRLQRSMGEALTQDAVSDGTMRLNVSPDGKNISLEGIEQIKQTEGLARINETAAKWLAGPEFMRPLALRGVTGDFGTTRKVTNDLFDHRFIIGKEIGGQTRGDVYERLLLQGDIDRVQLNKSYSDLYQKYIGVPKTGGEITSAIKAQVQGKMSYADFDIEVGKAMRRGDVHAIPQVQAAARASREAMVPRLKELQDLGILDETLDPKTAMTYFTRRYNPDKIVSEYDTFSGIVKDYFKRTNPNMDDTGIDDLTTKTIDNILGIGDQNLALSDMLQNTAGGGGKFTKERVFLIPDADIEDFLDSRASSIIPQWLHESDALISMKKTLAKNNWETVNDARKSLRSEFETKLAATTDEAERRTLNKAFRKELGLTNDMFNIALGQYGEKSNSALHALRKYNTWRMLGGMTVSAMPDIAMPIFKHGLPSAVIDGLGATARSIGKSKLAKDQLQDLAGYFELESSKILRNLSEPDYKYGGASSKFQRASNIVDDAFGKATLMSYWNNSFKRLGGHISFSRTIRSLKSFSNGKLSNKDKLRLTNIGIGQEDYTRILKQFDTHGEVSSGSYIGNFHLWTDKRAKDVMSRALLTDVDSTVLTPRMADLPKFVQGSDIGRTIFQFKSFMATATNNIAIKGIQRRDAEVLQGVIGLLSFGALSYITKEQIAGREPNTDIDNLLIEGISRSGLGGITQEYIFGVTNAFFGQYGSRYGGRSIQSLLGGPSADFLKDAAQTIINSTDGEVTDADAKRIQRMTPFGNLFYIRLLMTKLKGNEE